MSSTKRLHARLFVPLEQISSSRRRRWNVKQFNFNDYGYRPEVNRTEFLRENVVFVCKISTE